NSGISITGILRAGWSNVRGHDTQGGSTITQQYVKNAYLTQQRTFSRKMKEVILARKMDKEYSKDKILEFYLNTIFWGRGSYGIEAAAKAYFGVSASQLTTEQAALLAGIIKSPNSLDPETNPEGAHERWSYVIDGMVSKGWLDKDKAAQMQMPTPIPKAQSQTNSGLKGVTGTIMTRVQAELISAGISEQQINTGGLRITTTIDPKMQKSLNDAVKTGMSGQPKNLATGVVATEPGTGKIKAYYGGENGFEQFDLAGPKAPHPAGSSFKPYALARALEDGISINSVWDGGSPRTFPDRVKPVNNSEGNNSCKRCTLDKATILSLNTVYYAVTSKVGASKVAELAKRAGITKLDGKPIDQMVDQVSNNIGIGQYGISVIDQSAGFATFANGGVYAKPHFVDRVEQGGSSIYNASDQTTRAFSADVAADADTVLQHVVEHGASSRLDGGRAAGGKTGTQQYLDTGKNSHAWMVGFTPQLATAVWVGNAGVDGPIVDKRGKNVYGSGVPTTIWKAFMDGALKGAKKESFPKPANLGDDTKGDAPPEVVPSPSPELTDPTDPGLS
ncbi:MAG: transglycosylase domain-containing protein, partial [Candidatus Dormibacteraceae bacterium]